MGRCKFLKKITSKVSFRCHATRLVGTQEVCALSLVTEVQHKDLLRDVHILLLTVGLTGLVVGQRTLLSAPRLQGIATPFAHRLETFKC